MKKYIVLCILLIVLLVSGLYFFNKSNYIPRVQNSNNNEPPLLLKGIGVNLDYYDPATNRAGDFLFTKQNLHFKRLFMDYGFFIPSSSASPDKYNPQPTFILPLGTPVRSMVDGIVAS